jgi:nickel-dependent lactate racemase
LLDPQPQERDCPPLDSSVGDQNLGPKKRFVKMISKKNPTLVVVDIVTRCTGSKSIKNKLFYFLMIIQLPE